MQDIVCRQSTTPNNKAIANNHTHMLKIFEDIAPNRIIYAILIPLLFTCVRARVHFFQFSLLHFSINQILQRHYFCGGTNLNTTPFSWLFNTIKWYILASACMRSILYFHFFCGGRETCCHTTNDQQEFNETKRLQLRSQTTFS